MFRFRGTLLCISISCAAVRFDVAVLVSQYPNLTLRLLLIFHIFQPEEMPMTSMTGGHVMSGPEYDPRVAGGQNGRGPPHGSSQPHLTVLADVSACLC